MSSAGMLAPEDGTHERALASNKRTFAWYNSAAAILSFWLLSRAACVALVQWPRLVPGLSAHALQVPVSDVRLYGKWSRMIALHGAFPVHDPKWQYPPLAGLVMVAPRALAFLTYVHAFIVLALLMDLLVLVLLLRRADTRGGPWVWTVGLVLLGPTVFLRYDLFVTVPAVAALLALPRERVFGALAAVGAMLKVWPGLLLLGLPRDRRLVNAVLAAAGTAVAVLVGGTFIGRGQLSFLGGQSNRGMELEAVAVTPVEASRLFDHGVTLQARYGSVEFISPAMDTIATCCLAATLIGLAVVAFLAWRRSPAAWTPAFACDVALAATMVSIVTSRVLSPQYLIWVIGIGAACLAFEGSRQRPTIALILVASLLSQAIFPFAFDGLLKGHHFITAVLVVRNLLLVAATVTACRALGGDRLTGQPSHGGATGSPARP